MCYLDPETERKPGNILSGNPKKWNEGSRQPSSPPGPGLHFGRFPVLPLKKEVAPAQVFGRKPNETTSVFVRPTAL